MFRCKLCTFNGRDISDLRLLVEAQHEIIALLTLEDFSSHSYNNNQMVKRKHERKSSNIVCLNFYVLT